MGSSEEAAKTSEDLLYVGDPSLLPGGGRDLCLTAPLYPAIDVGCSGGGRYSGSARLFQSSQQTTENKS